MALRRFDAPTNFTDNKTNELLEGILEAVKKPPKKSLVDEAYENAEAEARKAHEAGPPANAGWVRGR